MMKKYLFISMFFLLTALISCKEDVNISKGLVAYYPFDGDAKDYSGNNNNGVVNGAVLTTDRFGRENSAYSFDGEKATIEATAKGMPAIDSPLSISWWFMISTKPTFINESDADNMIALVDSGKGIGIQFGFRAPGYETLGFDTWNWGGNTILEEKLPDVGKWHHCIYTFNGTVHKFYFNGIEIDESTEKTQNGVPTILMIGNYPSGNQYFAGEIDDIRIYNRELNQDEVNYLFNERK